jgi:hypothetical protein
MSKVRESVSHDLWTMTRKTDLIIPERWAENASRRLQVHLTFKEMARLEKYI